jgi:hypothetical protein
MSWIPPHHEYGQDARGIGGRVSFKLPCTRVVAAASSLSGRWLHHVNHNGLHSKVCHAGVGI